VIFWPNSPVERYHNGVLSENGNVMLKLMLEMQLVKVRTELIWQVGIL
jgi:hypothetical protein